MPTTPGGTGLVLGAHIVQSGFKSVGMLVDEPTRSRRFRPERVLQMVMFGEEDDITPWQQVHNMRHSWSHVAGRSLLPCASYSYQPRPVLRPSSPRATLSATLRAGMSLGSWLSA